MRKKGSKKPVVVDTSGFMNSVEAIKRQIEEFEWVLTTIVLEELDNLSKSQNPEKSFKARRALRFIEECEDCFTHVVNDLPSTDFPHGWDKDKNDNLILAVAIEREGMLLAYDRALNSKAMLMGVERLKLTHDNNGNDYYKGYKKIKGDTEFINHFFKNIDPQDFFVNEYLIVENIDTNKVSEMRFDGQEFVRLKLPVRIKGLNPEQRCALDLLNNRNIPIKVVMGGYGCGKTYLATQMGLLKIKEQATQSKMLVVREPIGEGKEVGFLKGGLDDKTRDFYLPIEHSLEGGEFELNSLIQRGMLEKSIPYYLKGTTYNQTYILCDEASDLSLKQIKMIGTRMGEDSEVVFVGDYKQSVYNPTLNNGLVRLTESLKGNDKFGVIVLDIDVRSEASRVFAEME